MSATQTTPHARSTSRYLLVQLVKLTRPRQWVKNLLVLIVPLAAGRIVEPTIVVGTLIAFAVFSLAASAVYMLNDVLDAEEDRRHPTKRDRPVASGAVPPSVAVAAGTTLMGLAVAAGWWLEPALVVVVGAYGGSQLAYALGLKRQPVLDLAVVTSGFVLRVLAGAAATSITVSPTLLLVASFGALFMVSGKRYSELRTLGSGAGTRTSLTMYSLSYLRFVWSLSASVTVVTYVLWARGQGTGLSVGLGSGFPWAIVSVAPFAFAMMRYAVDIDRGAAGAPEDLVLGDRVLQLLGAAWLVAILATVLT